MKWLIIILLTLYLGSYASYAQTSITTNLNLYSNSVPKTISLNLYSPKLIILQSVIQKPSIQEKETINDYVIMIILLITTFLTIVTPLILIFLWIYYSSIYVKKYRRIFSIKKWVFGKSDLKKSELKNQTRTSYRRVYSLMIGFGISIIAYSVSSLRFMLLYFDQIETALFEYFRFPFIVADEIGLINSSRELKLQFEEFWNQMLLIVVISALFFLIGYLLGALIVDLRFKYLKSLPEEVSSPKKIIVNKEMFHLKVKKDTTARSKAEPINSL